MHRPSCPTKLREQKDKYQPQKIRFPLFSSQSQSLSVSSQQGCFCSPSQDKEKKPPPPPTATSSYCPFGKLWNTFQFNFCINLQKFHCCRFTTLGYLKFHHITHIGYASFVSMAPLYCTFGNLPANEEDESQFQSINECKEKVHKFPIDKKPSNTKPVKCNINTKDQFVAVSCTPNQVKERFSSGRSSVKLTINCI